VLTLNNLIRPYYCIFIAILKATFPRKSLILSACVCPWNLSPTRRTISLCIYTITLQLAKMINEIREQTMLVGWLFNGTSTQKCRLYQSRLFIILLLQLNLLNNWEEKEYNYFLPSAYTIVSLNFPNFPAVFPHISQPLSSPPNRETSFHFPAISIHVSINQSINQKRILRHCLSRRLQGRCHAIDAMLKIQD